MVAKVRQVAVVVDAKGARVVHAAIFVHRVDVGALLLHGVEVRAGPLARILGRQWARRHRVLVDRAHPVDGKVVVVELPPRGVNGGHREIGPQPGDDGALAVLRRAVG